MPRGRGIRPKQVSLRIRGTPDLCRAEPVGGDAESTFGLGEKRRSAAKKHQLRRSQWLHTATEPAEATNSAADQTGSEWSRTEQRTRDRISGWQRRVSGLCAMNCPVALVCPDNRVSKSTRATPRPLAKTGTSDQWSFSFRPRAPSTVPRARARTGLDYDQKCLNRTSLRCALRRVGSRPSRVSRPMIPRKVLREKRQQLAL